MMDTRLPSNDINLGPGNELYPSNWEECGKLCNEEPLCKFWTYYVPTGGCWLKVANSGATMASGDISGNKNCPLPTGAGIKFMFSKKTTKINLSKSVNSNFTLAVRSRKFGQAKTRFLSHVGGKKEKKYG